MKNAGGRAGNGKLEKLITIHGGEIMTDTSSEGEKK